MKFTLAKYLPLSLIVLVILIINLYNWQSAWIALTFGFLFLIIHGYTLGGLIFPQENSAIKFIYGFLFLISIISSLGAVIYYFYKLDTVVISLLVITITIVLPIIVTKNNQRILQTPSSLLPSNKEEREGSIQNSTNSDTVVLPSKPTTKFLKFFFQSLLIPIYLLFIAYNFSLLFTYQTGEAIRSPWEVLPNEFFISYFFASLVLISLLLKNKKKWLLLTLISLHTLLSTSIALIVYKIGFGFDPFIHQATEKIILSTGAISPKPLYYLGQYSLVVFLSRLLAINFVWIDKLLVPLLTALFLPLTVYYTFSRSFNGDKKFILSLGLAILILPLDSFIVTTPQGLANFYLIITILFGLLYFTKNIPFYPLLILGATNLLVHPLSGIPIVIFLILLIFLNSCKDSPNLTKILKRGLFWEIIVLASLLLPSIFIIYSYFSPTLGAHFKIDVFKNPSQLKEALSFDQIKRKFNLVYDLVYFYKSNFNFIFLAISLIGFLIAIIKKQSKIFFIYLITFLVIFINFILLKEFLSFSALIEYEQSDYPLRIFEISFYFLIPLFLYAFYWFIKKASQEYFILKFIWLILITFFLTMSLYLSYPRIDKYETSHGFSTSTSDLKAVHYIDKDSKGKDYLVLVNQAVSAAAIREFGFKKYYHLPSPYKGEGRNEVFYYPIPTGGPLYSYYLDMVYKKPTRETMLRAMDLVGVNQAYFVINKYWLHSEKIIEEAMVTAQSFEKIDKGKVFVFKYTK